jgi:hypothetical protein
MLIRYAVTDHFSTEIKTAEDADEDRTGILMAEVAKVNKFSSYFRGSALTQKRVSGTRSQALCLQQFGLGFRTQQGQVQACLPLRTQGPYRGAHPKTSSSPLSLLLSTICKLPTLAG